MIDKQVVERAREIRIAAAKQWNCPISDIDWPSCIAYAYDEIHRDEVFRFESDLDIFREYARKLEEENAELIKENVTLENENSKLKEEIEKLQSIVDNIHGFV